MKPAILVLACVLLSAGAQAGVKKRTDGTGLQVRADRQIAQQDRSYEQQRLEMQREDMEYQRQLQLLQLMLQRERISQQPVLQPLQPVQPAQPSLPLHCYTNGPNTTCY